MQGTHAQKFACASVLVYSDVYVSDLHYLQEAAENVSASSLVTKAHRWNLGKGQQDEEDSRRDGGR